MSQTYPIETQNILSAVTRNPKFQALLNLPLIAWQELAIVITCYSVIIGGAALALNGLLPYPLVLITSGIAIYAIFTPLHDATHRSVSRNPLLNDFIGSIASNMMVPGVPCSLYRYLHLEHHRHTGNPLKDPDEPVVSSGPIGRILIATFIDIKWLFWYLKNMDNRSSIENWKAMFSLALNLGWYVAWLVSPYAMEFLLYWFLPQRLGLGIVATLFASIQHPKGVLQKDHPLQATRMFTGGWPVRLIMLSQSQHLMHHLFPMVPYYRYNKVWQLAQPEMAQQPLVWSDLHKPYSMPDLSQSANSTQRVTITSIADITDEIRAYTFVPLTGQTLPSYKAGAHIDVHIADGLIRQYSLTGLCEQGHYSIAVKKEADGRGGSRTLHDSFVVGMEIEISLPRNLFSLQANNSHAVLVSGGIGITPIMGMALALQEQKASFELHVCARDAAALPFADVLGQMDNVHIWLNTEGGISADALPQHQPDANLYMCGPQGFMDFIQETATSQGWPNAAIHSEAFVAQNNDADLEPFTVTLKRSGEKLSVGSEQSLLDALQEHGVAITASCEQGFCGTCKCKVVTGKVDHRDHILTDEQHQKGLMTSCVSRAANGGNLVLDL